MEGRKATVGRPIRTPSGRAKPCGPRPTFQLADLTPASGPDHVDGSCLYQTPLRRNVSNHDPTFHTASRFRRQPPRLPVDGFMKFEHHYCSQAQSPVAVPILDVRSRGAMKITKLKFGILSAAMICVFAMLIGCGCETFENHTNPIEGWQIDFKSQPSQTVQKDSQDYISKLPARERIGMGLKSGLPMGRDSTRF